jgi:hypothetical protein
MSNAVEPDAARRKSPLRPFTKFYRIPPVISCESADNKPVNMAPFV